MTTKEQNRIEDKFRTICRINKIKYGTKTYIKWQYIYFHAVISTSNIELPYYLICISAGREILKPH